MLHCVNCKQEELINRYAVGGRIKLPVTLFSDGLIYVSGPKSIPTSHPRDLLQQLT